MCYSALVKQDLKYLETKFGASMVRDAFEDYYQLCAQDPRTYRPLQENPRIYPLYFAPILHLQKDQLVIEPMRYQAWPEDQAEDPKKLTLYNARRDNLTSPFWSSMYLVHHGFLVMEGFFEWVQVKDLLRGGEVTEEDVAKEFKRQSELRKRRIEEQGKIYKPTATEKKPLLQRKTIIKFAPKNPVDLLTPVIFAEKHLPDGHVLKSFAVITDAPTPEIEKAGHDRRPLHLREEAIRKFVDVKSLNHQSCQNLLQDTIDTYYDHQLDIA